MRTYIHLLFFSKYRLNNTSCRPSDANSCKNDTVNCSKNRLLHSDNDSAEVIEKGDSFSVVTVCHREVLRTIGGHGTNEMRIGLVFNEGTSCHHPPSVLPVL